MLPYAECMVVQLDTNAELFLNTTFIMKNKKPLYFGSVKINKNYVSFHLMPVYVLPELLLGISLDLKKQMQGKSCFNFKSLNDELLQELKVLTERGFSSYQEAGYA